MGEGIFPSREWAWMIGILAGGGHVRTTNGAIHLTSEDNNLLSSYKSIGERLFDTNATSSVKRIQKDGKEYKNIRFFSRGVARKLSDLGRTEWYHTILEKHRWILENPRYTWSFLEGFFEMRGSFVDNNHKGAIVFNSSYLEVVNFICELLARVGVNRSIVLRDNRSKEGIKGVVIFAKENVVLFANNIHSKIPEKEEALEVLRRKSLLPSYVYSDEDAIKEWVKLEEALKRVPTSSDIRKMKREGKTKYSVGFYIWRFGEQRSFSKARENLERIIKEREAMVVLQNVAINEETQIFPPEN